MKKIITQSLFALLTLITFSGWADMPKFSRTYGGAKVDSGRDIAICPDSGFMMVGNTSSFGAGDSDIYVVKVNKMGDTMWTKTFGGIGEELAHSIVSTSDGNYVIAGSTTTYSIQNDDFWLLKIDQVGGLIWSKNYGSNGRDYAREVHETTDGGFVMVGTSNAAATANFDMLIVKTDGGGTEQWRVFCGGTSFESGYSIKQTSDGGYIALGQTYSLGVGGDVYMAKISSGGIKQWDKNFGGAAEEEGQYIQVTSDGGYVFTADAESGSAGDFDVMITKTDAVGTIVWQKMYGGAQKDVVKSIFPTSDGGYIVGAITRSFGLLNPDYWIMKLNANGDTTWTKKFGNNDHDHAYAVKPTLDGGYIAVGHQRTNNLEDFFLVKMDAVGNAVGIANTISTLQVVNVYPNPAINSFMISLPGLSKSSQLLVYDATGRVMVNRLFTGEQLSTQTEGWASGIYFISVTSGDDVFRGKVTVE